MNSIEIAEYCEVTASAVSESGIDLNRHATPQKNARNFLRKALVAEESEWADSIVLVADELVGNAFQYVESSDEVRLYLRLFAWGATVTVEDDGSDLFATSFTPREVSPEAESGRGLLIVDALSTAWTAQNTETGKKIIALFMHSSTFK